MSQNVNITSSDGSTITILPIVPNYTTFLADGLYSLKFDVTFISLNKKIPI